MSEELVVKDLQVNVEGKPILRCKPDDPPGESCLDGAE